MQECLVVRTLAMVRADIEAVVRRLDGLRAVEKRLTGGGEAGSVKVGTGYGDVAHEVRALVGKISAGSVFTIKEICFWCQSSSPKLTTVAGIMRRMVGEGMVELVRQGTGKRPSLFRRV